jgi:hypothetical protein
MGVLRFDWLPPGAKAVSILTVIFAIFLFARPGGALPARPPAPSGPVGGAPLPPPPLLAALAPGGLLVFPASPHYAERVWQQWP